MVFWFGRVALIGHGIEAVISVFYAPGKGKPPVSYGIYTFFVRTVGLVELFQLPQGQLDQNLWFNGCWSLAYRFVDLLAIASPIMKKQVKVKPNAKQSKVIYTEDGSLIIHLKSPPVDGKANQELITLLAKEFNVTKQSIRIKSGVGSRQKVVEIDD